MKEIQRMTTEATFHEILPDGTTRSGPGTAWHNPSDCSVSMQIPASEGVAADPGLPQGKCRPCGFTKTIDEIGVCTRCGWRAFQPPHWLVRDKDGRVLHWPQAPNAPAPSLIILARETIVLSKEHDRTVQHVQCGHARCLSRPFDCRDASHVDFHTVVNGMGLALTRNGRAPTLPAALVEAAHPTPPTPAPTDRNARLMARVAGGAR
jgi:hypothetical protein